ncbi:MAG TPA: ribonuclease HI family protein [Dehalococcoidia bacterium]|nr:ribonuclease HI family protein [Dehalococcoidia bacterium]
MHIAIYSDGASRGNPGPSAIGIVIKDAQKRNLSQISRYIGIGTNNNAEYMAVLEALREARRLKASEITLFLDSELIVKQLNGTYKVKSKALQPHFLQVVRLLKSFDIFSVKHIPRNLNSEADKLANAALNLNSAGKG